MSTETPEQAEITLATPKPKPRPPYFFIAAVALIAVVVWWFYGNPFGTNYRLVDFWRLGVCLVLAVGIHFLSVQSNYSFSSAINFAAMLIVPPALMPIVAFTLMALYQYKALIAGRELIRLLYNFTMFALVYFAGGAAFRLVASPDFERIDLSVILGVLLAYIAWVITNEGLNAGYDLVQKRTNLASIVRSLQMAVYPYSGIVPVAVIHCMILAMSDVALVVVWGVCLIIAGSIIFRLTNIQRDSERQNQQLVEQKTELEQITQREHNNGIVLAQSAGRLSSIAFDQSSTIAQQSEQLNEVAAIIEELSRSARQIADSAGKVATSAEQTLDTSQTSQRFLNASQTAIQELQSSMQSLVEQTADMANQSRQIDQLVDVIQEIAEETHMLAVNATIEASSAGEYGQRFAVVASEVNQLASRARTSSQQVQKVVTRMRAAVQQVLTRIELSKDQTISTDQTISQAAQQTEQAMRVSQRTTELARAISIATGEQRHGTQQAASTLASLVEMAEGAVRLSEKSRETAAALDRLSESMRREEMQRIRKSSANGGGSGTGGSNGSNIGALPQLEKDNSRTSASVNALTPNPN